MDDRTGELLYALGNVAAKQKRWYESFDYFFPCVESVPENRGN